MKRAWCFTKQNRLGCFRSLEGYSKLEDWTEGYVLDRKHGIYSVFVSLEGEVWYFKYEATVSYNHPSKFLKI
jgi:hypothetical protein